MSSFERVKEIFLAACDVPRDRRNAWLDDASAGDADLRAEVQRLLDEDADPLTIVREPSGSATTMPDRIGPYEVIREIGRGGMGVVSLARDPRLDRQVAVKALPAHLMHDADRLARFEREARVLAQLSAPNIAGIHGVEEQDGRKFLILEYVEGDTLGDRLEGGPLALDEALELAIGIAAGVEAAHEAGVVHRDLKPDNIKITPAGRVKVLDFGLAKTGDSVSATATPDGATVEAPRSPTVSGMVMGTAAYMSPEQARGRRVDKRTDIWAFGAVLFELLVGASPFAGESIGDSLGAILHRDVDLDRLPRSTPYGVRTLIRRCLTRDRAHRLHDIADARVELEEALRDPAAGPGEGDVRPARSRGPATVLAGVLLALALVAAGVAAGWLARPAPPPGELVRLSLFVPWERDRIHDWTLSPDGTVLAFAVADPASSRPTWSVHVRHLDREAFDRIHTVEHEPHALSFTPNGTDLILGTTDEKNRLRLTRLAVDGGRPVPLIEMPASLWEPAHGYKAWTTDQEFLVVDARNETIQAVSAHDGASRHVLDLPDDFKMAYVMPFAVVPGGRHVIMTRWGVRGGRFSSEIHVADLRSGEVGILLEDAAYPLLCEPDLLLFFRHRTLFATRFDVRECRTTGRVVQLQDDLGWAPSVIAGTWHTGPRGRDRTPATIDRGGHVTPLVDVRREFSDLALSPDETQLAVIYGEAEALGTIAVIEIASGFSRRIGTGAYAIVGWLPDGRLAFMGTAGESDSFEDAVTLMTWDPRTTTPPAPFRPDWQWNADGFTFTPNGETLIYRPIGAKEVKGDLFVLDLADPGAEPRPYLVTPDDENDPRLSPDGRWVAFTSDVSGQVQVYVARFVPDEPPRPVPVSVSSGYGPFWARDSSELFFYSDHEQHVMAAALDPSNEERFAQAVRLLDFEQFDGSSLAPMADGKRFVFFNAPENRPEDDRLLVVLNWMDEVRRRLEE